MNSTINDALLRKLADASGPCLTIVCPRTALSRSGNGLREALQKARKALRERDIEPEPLLEPITALTLEETPGSLIIFRSPALFEQVRTGAQLPATVTVEDEFSISPWLPLKDSDQEFYVLALALGRARLLRCTSLSSEEVELPAGTPTTLEESMSTDKPGHTLDNMSAAGPSIGSMKGVLFGTSADAEAKDQYVLHFFTQLDRGVRTLLAQSEAPLLVVAVDHERAAYARINTYPHLAEPGVSGAPDGFLGDEMHKRALDVLQQHVASPLRRHLDSFDKMAGTGHASTDAEDILKAAAEGRISQLVIRTGTELNQAVVETVRHGGSVFALPPEKMPNGVPVAAIYRYAVPELAAMS